MNPTTLSSFYHKGKSNSNEYKRNTTIKLRRQFSRMGFAVVNDSPSLFVDMWYLSMDVYEHKESKDGIKANWLSEDAASQLVIPIPVKKYIDSKEEDKELREAIESLVSRKNKKDTLCDEDKAGFSRLVDAGGSLDDIYTLYYAAANCKAKDLLDLLIKKIPYGCQQFRSKWRLTSSCSCFQRKYRGSD